MRVVVEIAVHVWKCLYFLLCFIHYTLLLCPSSLSCTFSRTLNYVWNRRRTKGKGHKPLSICFTVLYQFEAKWSQMSTWITVFLLIKSVRHRTIITWPHHFKTQFDPHLMTLIFMATSKSKDPLRLSRAVTLQIENLGSHLVFAGKSQKFCFKNICVLCLLNWFRICSFAHLFCCICPRICIFLFPVSQSCLEFNLCYWVC